jgi:hypothetical protein
VALMAYLAVEQAVLMAVVVMAAQLVLVVQ